MNITFNALESILSGRVDRGFLDNTKIGSSDCNQFIPYYSVFFHEYLIITDKDIGVIEYSKATFVNGRYIQEFRRYSELFMFLNTNSRYQGKFNFSHQGIPKHVFIGMNCVVSSEGEFLLCLGVDSDYLTSTSIQNIRESSDKSKLRLFISTELNNPIYKNLKKKLDLEYIDILLNEGVDTIYTRDIDNHLFKNNFVAPTFKTLSAKKKYLEEVLQEYITE